MNIVKVSYDYRSLKTVILVNNVSFDTGRFDGMEVADWAYPFMIRKIRWNGFYDEMVEALGGEEKFGLIFEGDEESFTELKEALQGTPVVFFSQDIVFIEYDEKNLETVIRVNDIDFDTSRIDGKEIADWIFPFVLRKVTWDGIFDELTQAIGTDEYILKFSGSDDSFNQLKEECPETVILERVESPRPAPVSIPEPVQPTVTIDSVISEIKKINMKQHTTFDFFFPGDPKFDSKLANANAKYIAGCGHKTLFTPAEQPLCLYDYTLFGNAKEGFVITTKAIYSHFFSDYRYIPISEITDITFSGKDTVTIKSATQTMDISGCRENEKLAAALRRVFEIITAANL